MQHRNNQFGVEIKCIKINKILINYEIGFIANMPLLLHIHRRRQRIKK